VVISRKMKKIIYTIAFLLACGAAAQAQVELKQTKSELAGFILLENDLLLYTLKEEQGQFIYSEQRDKSETSKKEVVLNAGLINAVVGGNKAAGELYVYQKNGRNQEVISFYRLKDGSFEKIGERVLPKMRNHAHNLGLFLSEDKQTLVVAAELGSSQGHEDLYISKWENNRWSKPKNLGETVNTRQPEFAPYVANDTLYFSRKDEAIAYNYSAPVDVATGKAGTPVKLAPVMNVSGTYNAYYKKVADRQMWISASQEQDYFYTAYLLEPVPSPKEEVLAIAPVEMVVEEVITPAPVLKTKAAVPAMKLFYAFNSIYLNLEEVSALARFLNKQPQGTELVIKGYSDGYGSAEAKDYVSRNRALQVKNHIEKYFAKKNFVVTLENEVRDAKGRDNRKTELYLLQ
jgi:outer membrane protein OmpA-like peptidoglycan-associated protein